MNNNTNTTDPNINTTIMNTSSQSDTLPEKSLIGGAKKAAVPATTAVVPAPAPAPITTTDTKQDDTIRLDPIAPIVRELSPSVKPKVTVIHEDDDTMRVRYMGIDLCYVNALRRTVLSDIPTVVFRTYPHSQNDSEFQVNTTRRNNEILKQRLSCIPIYGLSPLNDDLKDLIVEVKETNSGQSARPVTTEHFKVRRLSSGVYLSKQEVRKMFPPFVAPNGHEYYAPLVKLRPKLSDELEGDTLQFTCKLSVGMARENGSFNVASICSLEHVVDTAKQQEHLKQHMVPEWTKEGKDVAYETQNWLLLDGRRITVPNQYDLLLRSVGVYTNDELLEQAIEHTKKTFAEWSSLLSEGLMPIKTTTSTMERGYDIELPNENHTNGGILRSVMYHRFCAGKSPVLHYVGVKKMHPFHTHSLLRAAFAPTAPNATPQALAQIMAESIAEAVAVLSAMGTKKR
jgi:hypothetical protein